MSRILLPIPLLLTLALMIAAASGCVAHAEPVNGEYDTDGDGLIEVKFLEQLDAIRYDLAGDGKADDDSGIDAHAAAYPISGEEVVCDDDCNGYELTRPLDFNDADSYASGAVSAEWTTGEGWQPIQSGEVWILFAENPFAATFDGNGHTISNLYVNRSGNPENSVPAGLFGSASNSIICNVGLVDVRVAGFASVGGLVGANLGEIRDSYVTGKVSRVRLRRRASRFYRLLLRYQRLPLLRNCDRPGNRWRGRRRTGRVSGWRHQRQLRYRQRVGR